MCVNTRFNAEHTIIGNIARTCQELTKRVLDLNKTKKHEHKLPLRTNSQFRQEGMTEEQIRSMWDYMTYGAPNSSNTISEVEDAVQSAQSRLFTLDLDYVEGKDLLDDTDALWEHIHSRKV